MSVAKGRPGYVRWILWEGAQVDDADDVEGSQVLGPGLRWHVQSVHSLGALMWQ